MNIPLMTEDVNNISNQPDRIIGKASELKKIFDKGGSDIKNFINITLIPALEMYFESKLDKTGKVSELTNDGDGISPYATIDELIAEIAKLVDSSPDALNTLNELAAALGNDPNFATTILNHLSSKVDKIYGKGLSSNDFTNEHKEHLESLPAAEKYQSDLDLKVDKEKDKELSSNDYTSEEKQKVARIDGILNELKEKVDKSSFSEKTDRINSSLEWQSSEIERLERENEEKFNQWLDNDFSDCTDRIYINEENIVALERRIGNIDSALDKLHNYAQALISGGVS